MVNENKSLNIKSLLNEVERKRASEIRDLKSFKIFNSNG